MKIPVSMWPNAFGGNPVETDLASIIEAIKSPRWEDRIAEARKLLAAWVAVNPERDSNASHEAKAYSEFKKTLPAFCVSGTAKSRKEPLTHSNLLQIDFDKLNGDLEVLKEQLKMDAHILFGFTSPSGDGLKAGMAIDGDRHLESFLSAQEYFRQRYGREIDASVKDRLRLCFISHDPDAWIHETAEAVPVTVAEKMPLAEAPPPNVAHGTMPTGRAEIAGKLLTKIVWVDAEKGYCECPGIARHTGANGDRDCRITLGIVGVEHNPPTIHCFHNSCKAVVDGMNKLLRSEVGKAERARPTSEPSAHGNEEYFPTPEEVQKPKVNPWLSLVADGSDIQARVIPPVIEVINGLLTQNSKLVIASGSKSFKTWLSMDLALSVSHGMTFLGRGTSRRPVIYVNLELKPDTFERRIQAIAQARGLKIEPGWLFHLPLRGKMAGLQLVTVMERLIEMVKALDNPLIQLDPIYKLNTENDENSSREQTVFFNQLDRLTTEGNATVVLNDHFSKGNQADKDPLDAIRGSGAKGGDVDGAMILRRHEEDECFSVDVIQRELPAIHSFVIGWNYPLMEVRGELDAQDMRKIGGRKPKYSEVEVLAYFAKHPIGNPVSISSLSLLHSIPRKTLSDYCRRLNESELIKTHGEGAHARQYITDKGLRLLAET